MIFREVEDRDLIAKARQGDVEAYNLLVSRWEKRIFNYLLRLVSNREDALDISQETFLKAYQNLRKLDDPARFSAWLFRIAHNEAFSLLRRRKPESELSEPRPRDYAGRLLPIELSLAVESALKVLNEDQREAVLLKVYQGFKFDEMAEILEIPVSTVKSRLYTALDLLRLRWLRRYFVKVEWSRSPEGIMSCKLEDRRPDWKSYALGESDAHARQVAEAHVAGCSECQDELAGLRLTLDAMATLREEELPRRIAFVSDKVFEPRWYQQLSHAFLRPSFAAAGVIAAAILVHAFVRPVGAPAKVPAQAIAQVDTSAIEARITAEVTARLQDKMAAAVNTAVTKAVAETEKRDDQRTAQLLSATDRRYSDAADFLNKQVTRIYALNTGAGVR